jgi:hypothetical protein
VAQHRPVGNRNMYLLVGLWLIGSPPEFLDRSVASSIGSSLISSVIASIAIGWFFQQRLAKDVFEATLGYLLPEELKPELAWIVDQKILCKESLQEFNIKLREQETVMLAVKMHRRYKNFSRQAVPFKLGLSITPAGPLGDASGITEVGYRIDGDDRDVNFTSSELQGKTTIGPKIISLPPVRNNRLGVLGSNRKSAGRQLDYFYSSNL